MHGRLRKDNHEVYGSKYGVDSLNLLTFSQSVMLECLSDRMGTYNKDPLPAIQAMRAFETKSIHHHLVHVS